jgi:hypothetical protein
MVTLALCAAFMFLAVMLRDRVNNPGYQCPQCGTRRQAEHSEDCSWR